MERGLSLRRVNRGKNRIPVKALVRVASVAAGVQFGWALQLSLLTPYVQELGIPHAWASFIWLCGPISGMFVQPIVGHYSDRFPGKWGRRRPFIVSGAALVVIAVLVIGFSADLGYLLGDRVGSRPRAIVVFVAGFWLLDLANNTLQGPCRALLADFTGKDQRRTRRANAFFSLFMAIGNVLGFATGAYDSWYKIFWFTRTEACDIGCANLKSAFLLGVLLLVLTTILSVTAASEVPWNPITKSAKYRVTTSTTPLMPDKPADPEAPKTAGSASGGGDGQLAAAEEEDSDEDEEEEGEALFWELFGALRDLPRPMWCILAVTALTWLAWFPFLLFDTDWMGREVYRGEPSSPDPRITALYYDGVHMGSLGLMLNSVVLGLSSLVVEPLCNKLGSSYVWGLANTIMAACFAGTALLTSAARHNPWGMGPPFYVTVCSLVIFAVLGAPLAVTYSVPYALTATFTEKAGGGQGLSMGVLNLAVVVPQVLVSVGSGPWDELFGGGNLPAFLLGGAAALAGGIAAVLILPRPTPDFKGGSRLRRSRSSPVP
jgi:solute carrier family 45 protein 1/2/4